MTTAASGTNRAGRWYGVMVALAIAAVLVVTGFSMAWLLDLLNGPADPDLTPGEQAGQDLSARLALVDWTIRLAVLALLGIITLLGRRWMLAMERQANLAEAHLTAAREQLELTKAEFELSRGTASEQAAAAEQNLRSDRFSRAITQATGESAALRAVGLLALEELAGDYEDQFAATIYEFLVALIKENATPNAEQRQLLDSVSDREQRRSLPQIPPLDADAETAVAILTRNRELFDRNIASLAADTQSHGGTGLHLVGTDLSGVWLRGVSLTGATLTNVRLDHAVIVDTDLQDAVITDTRGGDATFEDVDFTKARFHSSNFAESTFTETRFDRAVVSTTDFGAAAISKTSFKRVNATGTDFVGAVFTDSSFDEALLTGTSFRGALFTNLGGAITTFTRSTLSSIAFNDATFAGTGFAKAAVNDADFSGARLTEVSFESSNLRQTNFASASLATVLFDDADLFDVGFEGANLTNTTLVGGSTVTDDQRPEAEIATPSDESPETDTDTVDTDTVGTEAADTGVAGSTDTVETIDTEEARALAAAPPPPWPPADEPSNVIHLEVVPPQADGGDQDRG